MGSLAALLSRRHLARRCLSSLAALMLLKSRRMQPLLSTSSHLPTVSVTTGLPPLACVLSKCLSTRLICSTFPLLRWLCCSAVCVRSTPTMTALTGIFTKRPGQLTNDFFLNLLDNNTTWTPTGSDKETFTGVNDKTGQKWNASRFDLVMGSHPELRAVSEVYGQSGAE